MGCSRGFQGIQYGRGQTSSTTTWSTFAMRRAQIYQLWNKEGISSLDQALLMCEMVHPYTSRYARVVCAAAIKTKMTEKTEIENMRTKYKGPIWVKKIKGQEFIFKAMTNLIVSWVCQNHPIIQRNNTYNYTLSHLYRVRGFHHLRHLYTYQMRCCKCPSSWYIWKYQ